MSRPLSEEQFEAFCRKNRLLSRPVKEWKNWFIEHPNAVDIREAEQLKANNTEQKGLIAQQQAQLATKEKQIVMKGKALAQYATMLALSKKPRRSSKKGQRIDEGKSQDLSELQACECVGIDPKTVRNWRNQDRSQCKNAIYIQNRTVLNKVAL